MLKKLLRSIKEAIKEDYKFILGMLLLLIILNYPLNYYITIGGGISDAKERISVEDSYKSKGSFNVSYVTQFDANILLYGLSYIIPSWEREDANLFKYNSEESFEDIEFRASLDLDTASATATYWAYKLANKEVKEISSNLYIIATFPKDYPTPLKVKDEILKMDGEHYDKVRDYINYLQTKEVGDKVVVTVKRDGKEKDIECELYELKGAKLLGVTLQYLRKYETNPPIKIKFKKSESGPSGGLITTLEIYNQLTKKDITKGRVIAGTGTINEDGSIGEIGGIEHKILGASSAKADIFLCPGGENYKVAKKYIKDKKLKIKLIKVETIESAIQQLEELDK